MSVSHQSPPKRKSIEAQGELSWHNNYFLGNDSSKWAPDCRNYTSVVYRDVWDGIDIEWYESNGKLEFDFVVQPGADPSQIRLSCDGLDGELSLSDHGRGEQCTEGGQHQGKSHSPATDTIATSGAERLPRNDQSRFNIEEGRMQYALTENNKTNNNGRMPYAPTHKVPRHFFGRGHERSGSRRCRTAAADITRGVADGTATGIPNIPQWNAKRSRCSILPHPKRKMNLVCHLPNGYSPDHTLRIDPLVYSTFLGGK